MSEIYLKTSEDILGYKNKERKEWISEKTWALIMERKVLKSKTNQATGEQQEVMKDLYNSKEKEVKKNAKADKKAYIDKIAEEAENASKVGDMRKLYNITKQLSGRVNTNSTNIKDKDELQTKLDWLPIASTILQISTAIFYSIRDRGKDHWDYHVPSNPI
ncbi:unnamed protein product [Mytilus edulis]|uniref:Uncharacterized protein n=1 Tax=Mytilus edulis TaxID=6550 RepID=A0A8S3QQ60_MYTED|nr:unnamed protein product [Mytilus edulis]